MDSWEDFDDEEPVAVAQGAYDEGNGFGDDDIKDSWDDDGDDEKTATPTTNQAPSKKKRSLQQILKEREAQEAQKLKEMAEKKAQMEKESLETEFERKARLAQAVRDADYQNAVALLGANNGTAAGITLVYINDHK